MSNWQQVRHCKNLSCKTRYKLWDKFVLDDNGLCPNCHNEIVKPKQESDKYKDLFKNIIWTDKG